ncbi:thiol-disulfide isomerase/thioredoxin [Yimella lutea]|uniref:Thiol-disulfide isomerase/thioredoxin n=1 Tax=Yimella lutea TaxID=587872 RepID=A0A542ED68_9MICO|nr:NHL domain-containing thioredoxin family protein [Yimella lutea]TQJ13226.1 thiol-disulfide isomerase/thioredoxin [Yimella lutea]
MVDRLRAPELRGRRWLNTGGEELSLVGLRGRIVVLDFWTFCCVNCLHVLDELRPLEQEFADSLVIIGVHSPKFEHEGRPEAVEAAVERYAVHHPVLDDPDLVTWDAYTARAWPTLVVIDPEGYIVGQMSGEGHGPGIASLVRELIGEHSARGTLRQGDSPYVPPSSDSTQFRFPGKAVPLGDGGFVVSDTAHHQIVLLESDLRTERARFGGPEVFEEPQGVCVLPSDAAERLGYDLLVADTVNHRIASIRLSDGRIRTEAGTGEQLRERSGGGAAHKQPLSSPWDIVWWLDRAVIEMAGTHQLWALHLATEPENNTVAVLAGTSAEGLRDGAADEAWLAQPSGLAVSASGDRVWIVDSETSALRSIVVDDNGFRLETHIGEGLFDFGFVDGVRSQARMQHPLGVAEAADGTVLVADTYNGAIRRFDPVTQVLSTALTGLSEPSDVLPLDDGLIVVESSAHRVDRMRLPATAAAEGGAGRVRRSATQIAPGAVELVVHFEPPAGQKLDDRYGDPTMLMVSSTPDSLIRSGGGRATGLARALDLDSSVGDGVLHISVRAAACDASGPDGEVPEHAACHLYQQDWGIPVRLEAGADAVLDLHLRGV